MFEKFFWEIWLTSNYFKLNKNELCSDKTFFFEFFSTFRFEKSFDGLFIAWPFFYKPKTRAKIFNSRFEPTAESDSNKMRKSAKKVWKITDGEWDSVVLKGHKDDVFCVSMSSGGAQIVSGSVDRTVQVWTIWNGMWESIELEGHTRVVSRLAMSADGSVIVSGGDDKVVRVWKERDREWESIALEGHGARINHFSISADGMQIVSEDDVHSTITWNFVGEIPCDRRN